jgi:hypothetical protein
MSDQNGNPEHWSEAVSAASRHVRERAAAEEKATERTRSERSAVWVVAALVVLAAVVAWEVQVLTRTPDPLSAREQEIDLRWLVADVVEEVEGFRMAEGRLPAPSDLLDLLGEDMVYGLRDGGYVVAAEGDGIHLEFDGDMPLAEWVALRGSEVGPEAVR